MGTEHYAIQAHFAAESGVRHHSFDKLFVHGATVFDDGTTIFGIDAIKSWEQAANHK